MNAPYEHTDGDNLDRRLYTLDNHLMDVFAADLDDPKRTEAFLAKVDLRASESDTADPADYRSPVGARWVVRLAGSFALALVLTLSTITAGILFGLHNHWTAILAVSANTAALASALTSSTHGHHRDRS